MSILEWTVWSWTTSSTAHLFEILIRFRFGKIALISDIKQAFLQIQIDTEDQNFLRFLWYSNRFSNIISTFYKVIIWINFKFILNAIVKFHIAQYLRQEKLKWVIETFLQDLYVDDSTTSFDNVNDAYYFYKTAKSC